MTGNLFKITPIGLIYEENGRITAEVNGNLCKGLKYISLFSHIILLYRSETQPNILNTNLSQRVVKLEEVREKEGKLIIGSLSGMEVTRNLLYDIKPYFPNEDRVKNAMAPSRPFQSFPSLCKDSLTRLGTIRKQQGSCFLEIPENFETWSDALRGFSHIRVIWWFHKFEKECFRNALECDPPYENAPKTGVFASRSPVRPNPIAMTTARIINIDKRTNRIQVSLLDCYDSTPLLGICPYLPERDFIPRYRLPQWLEHWPQWLDDRGFSAAQEPLLQKNPAELLFRYRKAMPESDSHIASFFASLQDMPLLSDQGIVVKGARQNNLKNIDVMIPYGKVTVVTGVSGSGKSSLAFDTIYAESQQRFLANMSLAERSQLSLPEKPDFDQISGLPPAIAISQNRINRNPRSTVGTATDLYTLLRTLFANIGIRHCPECGRVIKKMNAGEIVESLKNCKAGTVMKIRPFHDEKKVRTFLSADEMDTGYEEYLRTFDTAVRKALETGKGAIEVQLDGEEPFLLQTTEICCHCDYVLFELTATDFSFNNPESMCPVCSGLGRIMDIDPGLIVSDPDKSLLDGASPFWGSLRRFKTSPNANWMRGEILALADDMGINLERAWKELPEDFRTQAIYGSAGREVSFSYKNKNGRAGTITRPAEGAYNILKRLLQSGGTEKQNAMLEPFLHEKPCDCCKGERLKLESRLVTVADVRFPETIRMNMEELLQWISGLPEVLNPAQAASVQPVLQEIYMKLSDYIRIGLGYLSLDRPVPTLSGGEWQRLQLVGQLGSGLSNILYILDEPTAGLHPKDYDKLMQIINKLKNLHNTVLIVEHSPAVIRAADNVIDIGKEAGQTGGYVIAQGTPSEIAENKDSETGLYLSGRKEIKREHPAEAGNSRMIAITGIHGNNLKNISIQFPVNAMTCITGVSGSGKSTLVNYGILPAVRACAEKKAAANKKYDTITGAEDICRIVHITQKPIGRSSQSTPATYTGLMDEIRILFSRTPTALRMGYSPGRFSYNSKDGQCPVCRGQGYKTLDAAFMLSAKTQCHLCKGRKFNENTLQVHYKGKNIAQVLDMSIREAAVFFDDNKKLSETLQLLNEIGLGYLTLGQSSLTLSGGEAQRIKLAAQLQQNSGGNILYLLDEPTAGLHFSDIRNLLILLDKIISNGNTVIVVEHNPDMIRNADWVIDLGPEGGDRGGRLVVQGTVSDLKKCSASHTGRIIKAY